MIFFIYFFYVFAQNIDCWYMLDCLSDANCQGGSIEYPQSMFLIKNCKALGHSFTYKSGVQWGIHYMDMIS